MKISLRGPILFEILFDGKINVKNETANKPFPNFHHLIITFICSVLFVCV